MGTMIFNGISTVDSGVVIQTPPVYEFPTKRFDVIQIQGRNGDIIIDKNSYNNVNREYNLASVFRRNDSFISNVRVIVDWLSSVSGYARLEDSYEPEYFRLAMYRSGGQLPNFYDKATAIIVKFECKPQRFLKIGEIPITDIATGVWVNIVNDTKYVALPEITISGTDVNIDFKEGTALAPVGDVISDITISGVTTNAIIDSELQDCYDETEFLNNRATTTNGFPKLYPGNNWIFISSGATVTIKPRWWVL